MVAKQILAAIGYVIIVFPLALVWHIGLFNDAYHTFGYFDGEPNILIGLAVIVLQGVILSAIYPLFARSKQGFARTFLYCGAMGAFFWTSHVLALVAKQNVPNALGFIVMETGYLCIQFGAFAVVLYLAFHRTDAKPT